MKNPYIGTSTKLFTYTKKKLENLQLQLEFNEPYPGVPCKKWSPLTITLLWKWESTSMNYRSWQNLINLQ